MMYVSGGMGFWVEFDFRSNRDSWMFASVAVVVVDSSEARVEFVGDRGRCARAQALCHVWVVSMVWERRVVLGFGLVRVGV